MDPDNERRYHASLLFPDPSDPRLQKDAVQDTGNKGEKEEEQQGPTADEMLASCRGYKPVRHVPSVERAPIGPEDTVVAATSEATVRTSVKQEGGRIEENVVVSSSSSVLSSPPPSPPNETEAAAVAAADTTLPTTREAAGTQPPPLSSGNSEPTTAVLPLTSLADNRDAVVVVDETDETERVLYRDDTRTCERVAQRVQERGVSFVDNVLAAGSRGDALRAMPLRNVDARFQTVHQSMVQQACRQRGPSISQLTAMAGGERGLTHTLGNVYSPTRPNHSGAIEDVPATNQSIWNMGNGGINGLY